MPTFQDYLGTLYSWPFGYSSTTAPTAITITLASLATGGYRQSASVDNSTNLYADALLDIRTKTASTPTLGSTITFFIYTGYGSTYSSGASGADASYTAAGDEDEMAIAKVITVTASAVAYNPPMTSVAGALGLPCLPPKWGVIVLNGTGQSLDSTGSNHVIQYIGIK